MTDGLVKHEGVVSINDVPPYPSTDSDSNMCTFLSITLCAYLTHTQEHIGPAQTALPALTPDYSTCTVSTKEHPHRPAGPFTARYSAHTFTSRAPLLLYCTALQQTCCFDTVTYVGKYSTEKLILSNRAWRYRVFHVVPVLMV